VAAAPILQGVKVIELASVAAAPACGALLADYGATVTKIEPPGGDIWRRNTVVDKGMKWGAYFDQENRGKRSVVLDLKAEGGVVTLKQLLLDADVLITNVRSEPLERLGLDYATLSKEFPRLVYAHLSAWGREGPDMNLPGYDVGAFFAAAGVSDMLRGSQTDPLPRNLGAFGDHVTAIHLLSGIGLALFHQQRTGRGQLVDACLFRAAIFSAASWANAAHTDVADKPGQRTKDGEKHLNYMKKPREESAAVALMAYETSDGEWIQMLGLDHDVHVPRLCRALGLDDKLWAKVKARRMSGQELVAMADVVMKTRTCAEWLPLFVQHEVWHTVVAKIDDIWQSEQAR
jgi:crotonobetainyl-CoA:carnitine CoA-transferase CaiB-like acyl-CoA transferase